MIELSRDDFEALRHDNEFTLYRGQRQEGVSRILVLAPAAEYPGPQSLKRLEHECSLKQELDPAWAARPIELARYQGRTVLLLEDPGGILLESASGRVGESAYESRGRGSNGLDLAFCLRVGINLANAIGHLHRRGIVHKDIKPANMLVDSATGQVWLMGFGIASRLPRERQSPDPPEFLEGTLAYMAPEQTGRMNRSIDSRSDLYSLGVTLYQMLTRSLPFTASDPMEWVHCHIARTPAPPSERLKNVPAPVSAIIMRLLAKTAEERYQTATGVEFDLRRCLGLYERQSDLATRGTIRTRRNTPILQHSITPAAGTEDENDDDENEMSGEISEFPLGEHDMPDRLLIPEKLYGRTSETETLLAAFDRVMAGGGPELVLVSGYSGIGKSSVVNELHKPLVPPRGLFASGKFDQYKRDIPYATLAQAFQSLLRPLLTKSETELSKWRDALREALGPNGQLMVELVPELKFIIGEQPPAPELAPQEALNRFQMVFGRFVSTFARPEHPLALFLDDLQWLDAATLELLEHLITEQEVKHLLLVGAYRDNEVSAGHPLMRSLDAIRKAGASMVEIVLGPLELDDVSHLVADSLHCERDFARPLAELVHEKTAGNPFFAIQFLTALAEETLLAFDLTAGGWSWDLGRIRAKSYTDNVVDLMAGKLNRLPKATQEALGQLACLGNVAEIATLSLVQGGSEQEIHAALWEALRAGLVLRLDGAYTFVHDRVQEAAYALIPDRERAAVHLRIGRLFASRAVAEEMEEKIFEIVNQLDRGTALIDSPEERERVAELNLIAGNRAKTSTAYASALTYFAVGRRLLAEDSWDQHYALTFALELHRAECEFLTGDFAAAEDRLSTLSRHTDNLVDRAAVARLQTELYATLDRNDRAVEAALEYLRLAGINWSPHPTDDDVRHEYNRIWQQLGNRPIESLVDLPPMTDPACRATLDVLTAVDEPAFFTGENLQCLVVARMVNLSLAYGNSDGSCVAYLHLGWFVGPRFGDHQAAFRFGKLGLDLVEKRGLERFRTRVSQCFGYLINPSSRHLRTGLGLLRRSFTTAQEAGDLKYAVFSYDRLVTLLLAAGDPLGDVQREAENGLELARKAKTAFVADIITGQLKFIRTLRGLTSSFSSFNDAEFDEGRFEQHLEADPHLVFATRWYWIRKLQARFFAGDYASALVAATKAEPLLPTGRGNFESVEYLLFSFESAECLFYDALARAAQYDFASSEERPHYLEALAAHHKQINLWAENCPENFRNRVALVGAEIARIEGRELDAERLYEQAIRSARENGFVQNEGIANELAARFYAARGFEDISHLYRQKARYCYLRWGANGKVRQLDELHPDLREKEAAPGPAGTIGAPLEYLDLATVIKVSQAISGEILLNKLINKLMRIALEQAGAERGLLILVRGKEQRIEAEALLCRGLRRAQSSRSGGQASNDRDQVAVHFRRSLVTPSEAPESLLRYVSRTLESVTLRDASSESLFSEDEYVRRKHPRSVFCLPLIKQGALVGVLYLENSLAPGVFTSGRLAILELIASQAAISLEQARLYEELSGANNELQQAFQEIRTLKDRLHRENIVLREEIGETSMFEEIVGRSPLLKAVLARVTKVAPTDSTVLITGETGTGKELIARAIHKRSHRSERPFVKVSCAAIPHSLIASELFGHEKGSFTGALQQRLGRFELAERGTIFLDEIGELPPETQIALLRVLQEREFERVGGNRPISVDVRVIAATNRDLKAAIAGGEFRSDLFYRINVFPIEMPPLRAREEDIPMLVKYFIDRYARKEGKQITSINNKTLELLQSYPWPGNIRELQNVIERSVIVCDSESFSVDESWLTIEEPRVSAGTPALSETLTEGEKVVIEAALAQTRGRVSGPNGAAAKLGLPASTLEWKIKSLKIDKYRFKSL